MIEKPITFNSGTLNDGAKASLMVSPYYWIPVTNADGLFGDEIRTETHPNPCGPGEVHGEVQRSGKQVVLTGRIYARNLTDLRDGELELMRMFYDLQEHQLAFYFSPKYAQVYITAYCNQPLVITDEWNDATGNWRQDWTVGLRADDPTIYYVGGTTKFQSWM
jgi:hypothetical protein